MNKGKRGKKIQAAKWTAYSATAGAAMLSAASVDAAVTNITNFTVSGTSTTSVSLTVSNSTNGLHFTAGPAHLYFTAENSFSRGGAQLAGDANNLIAASYNGHFFTALKLTLGDALAGRTVFTNFAALGNKGSFLGSAGAFVPSGPNAAVTGYVEFKAINGTKAYLGWLRVREENSAGGFPFRVSLVGKAGNPTIFGAYDLASSAAADNFFAGTVAVPEPSVTALSGLGLLALGAAGVREMRRRKAQSPA